MDVKVIAEKIKQLPIKKVIVIVILTIIVIAGVVVGFSLLTNNYGTPVKTIEKYSNKESYDIEQAGHAYLNGLAVKDMRKIQSILHNSDEYLDGIDIYNDSISENYDNLLDLYGSDYKVKYVIADKTELTTSELKEYRLDIQDEIDSFGDYADEAEDYESSDWSDMADIVGLTKSETKELFELFGKLAENYKRLEVTEGYELDVTKTITGEYLDDPLETDESIVVLKVNGRWIAYSYYNNGLFAIWY